MPAVDDTVADLGSAHLRPGRFEAAYISKLDGRAIALFARYDCNEKCTVCMRPEQRTSNYK